MADKRVGFESPYKATYNQTIDIKNTGNDYSSNLMKNSFSTYMFRNPKLNSFIRDYMKPIYLNYINAVKKIRIFYNFTVPKDWTHIN